QTWTFTDDCDRVIEHIQTITIEPAPVAAFVNPPADLNLTCEEAITYAAAAVTLDYTNNAGTGVCLISGDVLGVIDGTFDECGGIIFQTWTFSDDCDRVVDHRLPFPTEPAPVAAFVNPPADLNLTCEEAIKIGRASCRVKENNKAGAGACKISGDQRDVIDGTFDEVRETSNETWTYAADDGRVSGHTQH